MAKSGIPDTGLGFAEFVKGEASPNEVSTAEVAVDAGKEASVGETSKESVEADSTFSDEPKKEISASVENTADEKSSSERDEKGRFQKSQPTAQKKDEKELAALKKDEKAAIPAKVDAAKPNVVDASKPNWDADENPYKKRHSDTAAWANRVNQENLALKRQMDEQAHQLKILNKKFDGTYDPEKDEPKSESPEIIQSRGEMTGKARASLGSAYRELGKENVNAALREFEEVFGQDELVQRRILMADSPVHEALTAIEGYKFFTKYGSDPKQIQSKIRQEVIDEELPKLRETVTKEIMAKLNKQEKLPEGLTKVRGTGDSDTGNKKGNSPQPLKSLFPNFS